MQDLFTPGLGVQVPDLEHVLGRHGSTTATVVSSTTSS